MSSNSIDSGNSNPKRLSIIIPCLNDHEALAKTLDSICKTHTEPAYDLEVIVVDASEMQFTGQLPDGLSIQFLTSSPGRSTQLNLGAAHAKGMNLLFLHADTLPPSGFDTGILNTLENKRVALGAFQLSVASPLFRLRIVEWGANMRSKCIKLPYGDQGLFLRRETFEQLDGFQSMPIMEDFDLVRRAQRLGRVVTLEQAVKTSDRRWRKRGVIRTTIINQMIVTGYFLGFSPTRLATLYRGKAARDNKR